MTIGDGFLLGTILACLACLLQPGSAHALVFATPEAEPLELAPPDFPYWEHVTQRRYEGPSVIYLGGGWALTARHVGMGEIFLEDEILKPRALSRRTLLNLDGSAADALVFEVEHESGHPDLPLLPIAKEPPYPGEELLLIGFGRGREKVVEWEHDGDARFAFTWDQVGRKRWGTNRVRSASDYLIQSQYATRSFTFDFDPRSHSQTTQHEASAATGDSGGAVFVKRDGRWELIGMMVSVSSPVGRPRLSSTYGDTTHAADLTFYRSEILRWTRSACANEEDDDGDDIIDFPADPGCDSLSDPDERDSGSRRISLTWVSGLGAIGVGLLGWLWMRARAAQRGISSPDSTSPAIDS